jgi:hypothetical protein
VNAPQHLGHAARREGAEAHGAQRGGGGERARGTAVPGGGTTTYPAPPRHRHACETRVS